MTRLHNFCLGCVTLAVTLVSWQPCVAAGAGPESLSGMVLGGGNSLLAEGSIALQEGRITDGIRMTQEGLKDVTDPREAAGGHTNLCAGYVLLHEWALALEQCNAAIELDRTNWRPLNNRAAAYAGLGRYDLALVDLRAGLELDPQSSTLQKSMAVVEHNQRVINRRDSSLLRS